MSERPDTPGPSPKPSPTSAPVWRIVVPVKEAERGKSRLGVALERAGVDTDLAALARAFALDTLVAAGRAVGARRVILVTSDLVVGEEARRLGVTVVADPGDGLNAAVVAGLARVPEESWAAALLGDLPAVTPEALRQALSAAGRANQSFVPDAEGTGTVLRAASTPRFQPRFGPESAAAHAGDGAARLDLDLPALRTDVDDLDSLTRAAELGLGRFTASVVGGLDLLGWAHAGHRPRL